MEQYYAIKFCVKLKKTKQEVYGMLMEAYGDEQMSKASFTEPGLEPEISGLMRQRSYKLSYPGPTRAVPQIVHYLCSQWGASQKP